MRLRNRKTGEIIETQEIYENAIGKIRIRKIGKLSESYDYNYDSLAELNEEWEDYEEPKKHYFISNNGQIHEEGGHDRYRKERQEIGNDFEKEEEAEKAVRKLKAWQRLQDKGFKFEGREDLQAEMGIDDLMLFNRDVINTDNVIGFRMDDYHDCIKEVWVVAIGNGASHVLLYNTSNGAFRISISRPLAVGVNRAYTIKQLCGEEEE